jgi:hypothetical protein
MRKYTIKEIDKMRSDLRRFLTCVDESDDWMSWNEPSDKIIELQLRTYLEVGIDPEELSRLAKEKFELLWQIERDNAARWEERRAKEKLEFTQIPLPVFQEVKDIPASENPKVIEKGSEGLPLIILCTVILSICFFGLFQLFT